MKTVSLGQLFELKYGKSLRKDKRVQGKVPVYGSNGPVDTHNVSYVSEPTIIVGRKGSIGEVHLVQIPCWPIDTTYFIEPLGKYEYNIDWLYRLLKTLDLQSLNRSAAIPGLNRDDVYRIEVSLPSPDDQKRIGHLLGKVEGLINQRKLHLQQLDDLLKSVFLEMFGDPELNEKAWKKNRIGRAVKVQGGFAFKSKDISKDGTVRIAKIANVHFESLVWDDISYVPDHYSEKYNKFALNEGDLLIALTRPIIKSLDVVKTATVKKIDLPCLLNQRVARFTFNSNQINQRFFLQYCYTRFFRGTIDKLCPPGLQPNVSTKQIEDIPIYYPPIELQKQFEKIAIKVDALKSRYHQSLTDLESLYGALSQKAFKGELDLSQVPLSTEGDEAPLTAAEHERVIEDFSSLESQKATPPGMESSQVLTEFKHRKHALEQWLTTYIAATKVGESVSIPEFMERAYDNLLELSNEGMLEELGIDGEDEFSVSDYDYVRSIIFEMLEKGSLLQKFDDDNNTIQLVPA